MEEQVFFPGPYYPKPWLTVKPEELSSGKSAGSADCAGGSSSGKRVRRRTVKGDEFDKRGVEMQSDDDDDDDDEDEGPSKAKRKPKKKDKSELEMDPAFHWCYGAPKDYANQLTGRAQRTLANPPPCSMSTPSKTLTPSSKTTRLRLDPPMIRSSTAIHASAAS